MAISKARKAAYQNLLRIERDSAFSSEVLARTSRELSRNDQNLSHNLTLGVLRKQLLLDFVIGQFSNKAAGKLDVEVLIILRLALFQIHFLDRIPDYSAINEAVELTRFARKKSAAGFVNAVLRKGAKWDGTVSGSEDFEQISLETSHPKWLIERWASEFGIQRAESLATANNTAVKAAFRFTRAFDLLSKTEQKSINDLISRDPQISASELLEGAFVSIRIGEKLKELSESGVIYFQDEASQIAAQIVSNQPARRILDVCAAPGSKSTLISRQTCGVAHVFSGEYHLRRAKLLKNNALKQKADLSVVCLDGRQPLPFECGAFETILVDAPCTGTGTIRRNPEIRYRISPMDLEDLHQKQLSILSQASKLLNSGGVLIYSTCSLEREENDLCVTDFLEADPGFELFDPEPFDGVEFQNGIFRTFPDLNETDGFFVSCLRKR